ncbi:MAG: aspartate aminotransferase family protein [Candidatus Binataceae bacterium]
MGDSAPATKPPGDRRISGRATKVFHRAPRMELPRAVAGEGVYILDAEGKRYLDASGGAAVSCLGHSHQATVRAIQTQITSLPFAHTGFFTNEPMEELAAILTDAAPGDLRKAYFVSGGSEGVEAALKLARQYAIEKGEPQRTRIVSRRQSYHGNTLGALSAGGNMSRRAPFEPLLMPVRHIAPCYAYRDRRNGETEHEYGMRVADELESAIEESGPETVLCFIAETVSGATLGCVPPVPGYFARIREICDQRGVLLILDEVMCGMGRTGTLFACEQESIAPDILVVAKGLGAGYQPIGAALVSDRIFETIVAGSGYFQHGHTYMGHTVACAAAVAVQKAIRDEDLLANVRCRGADLASALGGRFGNDEHVGDIRGRGLFMAIELVRDRATKEPFDPALNLASRIKYRALENGLVCYPMGGVIDGRRGDHVMLAPPYIVERHHIGEMVDKLDATIGSVLHEIDAA